MKKYKKTIITAIVTLLVIGIITVFLFYNGILQINNPSDSKYPVKGVDVSCYQGNIDWDILSSQNISFAFIKATEGSTMTDDYFKTNFENAQKTNIAVGAYHFFSYDSLGITQAENFIKTVKPFQGMLPPVIDLEFYGDKETNPPSRDYVKEQLTSMLDALENYYGLKPIIYCTEKSYNMFLSGEYEEYDIWIRAVYSKPKISDRQWTFWQYSNRKQLKGYDGQERFIDMNLFNGTKEEFENYPRYNIKE